LRDKTDYRGSWRYKAGFRYAADSIGEDAVCVCVNGVKWQGPHGVSCGEQTVSATHVQQSMWGWTRGGTTAVIQRRHTNDGWTVGVQSWRRKWFFRV